MTPLADHLKSFEKDSTIPKTSWLYVRLDGRAFHTFTKSMKKPFDSTLLETFHKTCLGLMEEFSPKLIYHQSDEINLYFQPCEIHQGFLFGGRVQKLASVLASQTAILFFKNFCDVGGKSLILPSFDARIVGFENQEDLIKMFYWRFKDCWKNSTTMIAQSLFTERELHEKNTLTRLDMIGDTYYDFSFIEKFGTFFQKNNSLTLEYSNLETFRKEWERHGF